MTEKQIKTSLNLIYTQSFGEEQNKIITYFRTYTNKQTKIKLFCWNLKNKELMHGLHFSWI